MDGTPADCVNLALVKLLPRRPDLVVSGHQPRREPGRGRLLLGDGGRRARGDVLRHPVAGRLAGGPRRRSTSATRPPSPPRLAALVLEQGLPARTLLNVNVPPGKPRARPITVQGRREHEGTILEGIDPRRRPYFWIEEGRDRWVSGRDVRHPRGPRAASSRSRRCRPTPRTTARWRPARLGAAPPKAEAAQAVERWCPSGSRGRRRAIVLGVCRSGRGSAWLERLVRDQEVGGSNPLAPTILLIDQSYLRGAAERRLFLSLTWGHAWATPRRRTPLHPCSSSDLRVNRPHSCGRLGA